MTVVREFLVPEKSPAEKLPENSPKALKKHRGPDRGAKVTEIAQAASKICAKGRQGTKKNARAAQKNEGLSKKRGALKKARGSKTRGPLKKRRPQ
jgi:hypothetical protein